MLRQKKKHTLLPSVRPHILRIVEMKGSGLAMLQGSDGSMVLWFRTYVIQEVVSLTCTTGWDKKGENPNKSIFHRMVGRLF